MKRLKIGVDLDGVLYDFVDAYRTYCIKQGRHGIGRAEDVTEWDFYKQWGITSSQFHSDLVTDADDIYGGGYMLGWGAAMPRMRYLAQFHDLYVITSRPQPALAPTLEWVADNNLPVRGVILCDRGKTDWGMDVLVDDSPEVIVGAQKRFHPCPIIFDQPWNGHIAGRRAYGWEQLTEQIIRYGKGDY